MNNRILLIIIVVGIVVLVGVLIYGGQPKTSSITPPSTPALSEDSTTRINADLENLNVLELEPEFQTIDRDLKQL